MENLWNVFYHTCYFITSYYWYLMLPFPQKKNYKKNMLHVPV